MLRTEDVVESGESVEGGQMVDIGWVLPGEGGGREDRAEKCALRKRGGG